MTITKDNSPIQKIKSCLPSSVSGALSRLDKVTLDRISEIRLRADAITTITIEGQNKVLSVKGLTNNTESAIKCSKCDIEDFIYKFCKGSVYTHENTINECFIVNDAIRVGLGFTGTKNNISSVNIRLARHIPGCSRILMQHIRENGFIDGKGILIISRPGDGKTTLLRDIAVNLSSSAENEMKRVCVIDERNEIYMENVFNNCCIDFLSGLDKCKGIETAARLLSPQIIICDEISGSEEAEKLTKQKNSGIVFIASFHADSFESAFRKSFIRKMFEEQVFSHMFLLSRNSSRITGTLCEYNG